MSMSGILRSTGLGLALGLAAVAPAAIAQDAADAEGPRQAVFRALDKVTARVAIVEAPVEEPARFGSLELMVRTCAKRPPEEPPEVTAFVEIRDLRAAEAAAAAAAAKAAAIEAAPRGPSPEASIAEEDVTDGDPDTDAPVFSGWMFASSPGLSALEHPVYDIWLIDCKTI